MSGEPAREAPTSAGTVGVVSDSGRRANGSLEREVLECLWRADGPRTAGQVRGELGGELAYTTVMTILSRLFDKDLVGRELEGRSYRYTPTVAAGDLAASRMQEVLAASGDRRAALTKFVAKLSTRERASLLEALGGKR